MSDSGSRKPSGFIRVAIASGAATANKEAYAHLIALARQGVAIDALDLTRELSERVASEFALSVDDARAHVLRVVAELAERK